MSDILAVSHQFSFCLMIPSACKKTMTINKMGTVVPGDLYPICICSSRGSIYFRLRNRYMDSSGKEEMRWHVFPCSTITSHTITTQLP